MRDNSSKANRVYVYLRSLLTCSSWSNRKLTTPRRLEKSRLGLRFLSAVVRLGRASAKKVAAIQFHSSVLESDTLRSRCLGGGSGSSLHWLSISTGARLEYQLNNAAIGTSRSIRPASAGYNNTRRRSILVSFFTFSDDTVTPRREPPVRLAPTKCQVPETAVKSD